MLVKTYSATLLGVEAHTVEVEINATGAGEESTSSIVGLPDAAVRESRDRVRSAMGSNGYGFPLGHTVIGLAPADMKKEGSAFDLAIGLGLLATLGDVNPSRLTELMVLGELAFDGSVRPVKGVLPIGMHARKSGRFKAMLVPAANAEEASVGAGKMPVYGIESLRDAVELMDGNPNGKKPARIQPEILFRQTSTPETGPDFSDVKGQSCAKRALEIAAAGGHNVLLIGPPGTGKSLLSRCLTGILPPMSLEEALETTKIHSIAGLLPPGLPLLVSRPFRSPHHTISDAGLIGGGKNIPNPGEISLAHNGVLFLDELPEFRRNVLEVLRQPLETGDVTISRAQGSFLFPARFVLLAAMNPCPCGYHGSTQRQCRCGPNQIQRYRGRISGPLLDRIDIHVEVSALSEHELVSAPTGEPGAVIAERVLRAREKQQERFHASRIHCNSQMSPRHLQDFCQLDRESLTHLRHSIREFNLSARAYDRILRVARTIADLKGEATIGAEHVYESIQYRGLDHRLW